MREILLRKLVVLKYLSFLSCFRSFRGKSLDFPSKNDTSVLLKLRSMYPQKHFDENFLFFLKNIMFGFFIGLLSNCFTAGLLTLSSTCPEDPFDSIYRNYFSFKFGLCAKNPFLTIKFQQCLKSSLDHVEGIIQGKFETSVFWSFPFFSKTF